MPNRTVSRRNGVTYRGNDRDLAFLANRLSLVLNDTTLSRASLMQMAGGMLPPLNIDAECRFPTSLNITHYQAFYDRMGPATRVVSVYPEEAWQMSPDIYEDEDLSKDTQFEQEWREMNENLHVFTHMQTANEKAGIGSFGGLLLGFNDGAALSKPVAGISSDGTKRDGRASAKQLIYLRALGESEITVDRFDVNQNSPRFGKPEAYKVQVLGNQINDTTQANEVVIRNEEVHWTRIIHIADGDVTFAVPRQQPVYNFLWNIHKIMSANGQGYWNAGLPVLSLETQSGIENPVINIEETKAEVQKFLMGLQRDLATNGLTAKMLNFQLGDPGPHFEAQLDCVCITIACPKRVFKGTEEAKLASSQDMRTWNRRLVKYQDNTITPVVLRQFFQRMFLVGALTKPKQLIIKWPDLNAPTEADRANTAAKITDALVKYVSGNVFTIMGPKEYLVLVLGFSLAQVEAVIKASGGLQKMLAKLQKFANAATQPTPSAAASTSSRKRAVGKTKKAPVDAGAGANS